MQHTGPALSVIVPTFNEASNVEALVTRLAAILSDIEWEVIFVDDNSPDGTSSVVRRIGRNQPQVRCLQRIGRRGLSTACIEGMLASSAPYLAIMDCDFQHDPAVLRTMYGVLESGEAELVIGSRYAEGGGCGNWSRRRHQISRMGTAISKMLIGQDMKDPMSNFFALRRELFDEAASELSGLSFKILLDLLLTIRHPVRFCEIPITLGQRTAGESKFELVVAWEFAMLVADKTVGRYVPVRFLVMAGNGGALGAIFLGLFLVAHKGFGLTFFYAGVAAVTVSIIAGYQISNVLSYGDRRRHGLQWVRGLLTFILVSSIGAAANLVLANYLYSVGADWFVSAAAGTLLWLAWDFTGASPERWGLGRYLSVGRSQSSKTSVRSLARRRHSS
ncbi:glycosyltransferase family 2 protein [Steroidobacter sp. S1-65]|uniref:Glycosyltransferase family 2 protein n=1 Tax=Steroidobacter gossypii TaxID=2805490 RepID=A0ABS1X013_9GAMM|nr:glycosyltransferase family 2 protein [Steroidobacter gossypii]MBM0106512.1 glycosyltransferase family 2 protein [Steroidobacter gossypii]